MPPTHLVALWDYLNDKMYDEDEFEGIIAFAVIRLPELFLPGNLRPVQNWGGMRQSGAQGQEKA